MKYIEKLQEFLKGEFEDMSMVEEHEIHFQEKYSGFEYYNVDIEYYTEAKRTINFRVNEEVLEVELGEDCWHECKSYDWTLKHFYCALLEVPKPNLRFKIA